MKKNPNLKKVPTIDEFGGYWKYNNTDANLIHMWEEDLNQKITMLDLEWEREYGPLREDGATSEKNKRRKTEDFTHVVEQDHSPLAGDDLRTPSAEVDSLFDTCKKVKRNRNCSDLTAVTGPLGFSSPEQESETKKGVEDFAFNFDSRANFDSEDSYNFFNNSGR